MCVSNSEGKIQSRYDHGTAGAAATFFRSTRRLRMCRSDVRNMTASCKEKPYIFQWCSYHAQTSQVWVSEKWYRPKKSCFLFALHGEEKRENRPIDAVCLQMPPRMLERTDSAFKYSSQKRLSSFSFMLCHPRVKASTKTVFTVFLHVHRRKTGFFRLKVFFLKPTLMMFKYGKCTT